MCLSACLLSAAKVLIGLSRIWRASLVYSVCLPVCCTDYVCLCDVLFSRFLARARCLSAVRESSSEDDDDDAADATLMKARHSQLASVEDRVV